MTTKRHTILASLSALILAGFLFAGCDLLDEATSVDVPVDVRLYPESVNPTTPQVDVDCTDLNSLKDYADNKDMIESGNLEKATFQVIDLQQPTFDPSTAIMENLDFYLEFDAVYGDDKSYHLGSFLNVAFADVMNSQMSIPLNNDAKQAINKILDGQEKFCVKAVYGPLTTGPASATYLKGELILTVKFTAGVL